MTKAQLFPHLRPLVSFELCRLVVAHLASKLEVRLRMVDTLDTNIRDSVNINHQIYHITQSLLHFCIGVRVAGTHHLQGSFESLQRIIALDLQRLKVFVEVEIMDLFCMGSSLLALQEIEKIKNLKNWYLKLSKQLMN